MANKETDTYKTIITASEEVLHKDKKSKFYGYAFPISSEEEVKPIIEALKKKHHTANHICYAWRLGTEEMRYRANDDGEPNNSAGAPIYGQILSYDVTNILVAVARIFGGTKLGVGGLISAYKTSAQIALEASAIVVQTMEQQYKIDFDYPEMNKVMRIIKQNSLKIISQKMEIDCTLILSVRKNDAQKTYSQFSQLQKVIITEND